MGLSGGKVVAESLGGMGVVMMTAIHRQVAAASGGHNRDRGSRKCNLCNGTFTPKSPFERFCPLCKETNELLRFVHWLPEAGDAVQARLPA